MLKIDIVDWRGMAIRKRVTLRVAAMMDLSSWIETLKVATALGDDEAVLAIRDRLIETITDMYMIENRGYVVSRYNDLVRGPDMIEEVD
jgi:hypothetical protein